MEKKKAIITGITGQDGSYLSDLLLSKNYKVVGVSRRTSTNNTERIKHNLDNPDFEIVEGDITDSSSITGILKQHNDVSEFYNLAAQSVVEDSLLPVKSGNKVSYKTFKELWDNQLRKNKCIRKEYFKNTEIEVIDITPTENSISALGYANSAGNWFKITQISRHKWNGKVAKLSQKFGSVTVTPNHSLIDIYGNVVQPETNPWMLNIRKINSSIKKPIKKLKRLK